MNVEEYCCPSRSVRRIFILTLLFAFLMAIPTFAYDIKYLKDNYTYTNNNVTWRFKTAIIKDENGDESIKAVIYGCDNNSGPSLTFPSTVKDSLGNSFTVIGVASPSEVGLTQYGFSYYSEDDYELAELHFPDSVYLISEEAFNADGGNPFDLIYLIDLPDNKNLSIGYKAFQMCGCNNGIGTTVQFGSKPIKIDKEAFCGCTGIETITLPEGSEVSDSAFEGCTNMTSLVNAPASLYMGEEEDNKLESIVFDPGITEVGGLNNADEKNLYTKLTTVTLPPNCKKISRGAFINCEKLTTINNLNWSKLEYVGDQAFYGCKSLKLTNVIWNQEDIEYQFKNSGLVSITLPAKLNLLYAGGFTGCPNLTAINVASGNKEFSSVDGVLFCNSYKYDYDSGTYKKTGKRSMMKYPAGKNKGGKYTVPSDVETIGGFTFEGCQLAEVNIPVTVKELLYDYMSSLTGDSTEFYPFDNAAKSLVVYIVKGSHVDGSVQEMHSNVKFMNGPKASIKYNLNGGTNASGNPTYFITGNEIYLNDPTKKNCRFAGWDEKMPYQPRYEELEKGVTFTAYWTEMTVTTAKSSYPYTGKAIKPALTVKVTEKEKVKTLKPANYTVTWKKNKAIGKATVTVKGIGNYEGCVATATFDITPAKVKKVTAVSNKKKTATISWKKHAKAAKISGYQVQMATDKKFKNNLKKANAKASKSTVTIKKLQSKKTYFVRVRAKKKVDKTTYYGPWSKTIKVKIK